MIGENDLFYVDVSNFLLHVPIKYLQKELILQILLYKTNHYIFLILPIIYFFIW